MRNWYLLPGIMEKWIFDDKNKKITTHYWFENGYQNDHLKDSIFSYDTVEEYERDKNYYIKYLKKYKKIFNSPHPREGEYIVSNKYKY